MGIKYSDVGKARGTEEFVEGRIKGGSECASNQGRHLGGCEGNLPPPEMTALPRRS